MTSRLVLEYDGGGFAGWAAQPGVRTVQGEVERALAVVLRKPVPVTVAGRTDAGVHALGQVCSYEGPPAPLAGLNALLPGDVAALACCQAPDGFDARRDATSRLYCYRVLRREARSPLWAGRALHWPGDLDLGALRACADALVGTHDFTAFTPTQTEHVRFERQVWAAEWRAGAAEWRVGAAEWRAGASRAGAPAGALRDVPAAPTDDVLDAPAAAEEDVLDAPAAAEEDVLDAPAAPEDDVLEFWIEADAFMRQMNRILVGTMLEVAGGRRSVESFEALLAGRPRSEAGRTAPPHGLYLAGVGYGGRWVLAGAS